MYKSGFEEVPWLYQDFDLLDFYRVSEDELNRQLSLFRAGMYKHEWYKTDRQTLPCLVHSLILLQG